MLTLNRTAIALHPKQPFVDWINGAEPDDEPIALAEVSIDLRIYLIDEDPNDDSERALRGAWREIMEEELFGWCTDEAFWPAPLTYAMFREWFDVEIHSVVKEIGEGPLISEDL